MPKGVEHDEFRAGKIDLSVVRIPMMPKGVQATKYCAARLVRIPMMPKGVEH